MGKTLENRFLGLLKSLDNIWAKLFIIGTFIVVGFKFGCYYKETQMKTEQMESEKEEWLKTAHYIDSLRSTINELQKENGILSVKVELYSNRKLQNGREK